MSESIPTVPDPEALTAETERISPSMSVSFERTSRSVYESSDTVNVSSLATGASLTLAMSTDTSVVWVPTLRRWNQPHRSP